MSVSLSEKDIYANTLDLFFSKRNLYEWNIKTRGFLFDKAYIAMKKFLNDVIQKGKM